MNNKSLWFWIGTLLLSASALLWLFLIIAIAVDPEDIGATIGGGVLLTGIPIGIGIYGVTRRRKATDAAKESTESRALPAKQKVLLGGFWHTWPRIPKELSLTDRGISIKGKLNLPYSSLAEISGEHFPAAVYLQYRDERGRHRGVKIIPYHSWNEFLASPIKGLKLYSDIATALRAGSGQHRIKQRPVKKLMNLAQQLRAIGAESEFIDPEVKWNRFSEKAWRRDLGGLRLSGTNLGSISVTEEGWIEVTQGAGQYPGSVTIRARYDFDYELHLGFSATISCNGSPRKKLLVRVIDYVWKDGRIASRLNQDAELRQMLTKAKAPPMQINTGRTYHIYVRRQKFPSQKLFQCIERIAEHIRAEASS